jgi:hypothetical protein
MSLGEDRVRITFNPSNSDPVADIKQRAAELIDLINEWPKPADPAKLGEFNRLVALASTGFEDGAMWAVKAATMPTG